MGLKSMSQKAKRHLIIKYGNQLAQGRDTIAEHQKILRKRRAVWFGKVGAGIGKGTIAALRMQISAAHPTYLFLFRNSEAIELHRARVSAIEATRPNDEESMIPAYYAACGLERQMRLWIKITDLTHVSTNVLDEYHTASSGKKAMHTASHSMASVFIISEGASTLSGF